jgi:hypothetical protein
MERKASLFHRRRRVHTISKALSCLVDSAVIKEDNSSVQSMGEISDLYKYEPNHGTTGIGRRARSIFGNLAGCKYSQHVTTNHNI